jgi:2-polyprenyl-3-methyl-5-hydroxy-6-metoxy-1,4-benzoquinol methylase
MIYQNTLQIRKLLARTCPKYFSRLYSTLDEPIDVPVQVAAYRLVSEKYIKDGDRILDVGFGLGYGFEIFSNKTVTLTGIDIDLRAVEHGRKLINPISKIIEVRHYNGKIIPYNDREFDVVTCIDVLEHVPNYIGLIEEMIRVSNRIVIISTPNCRPEYTRPDGKPRNHWHLREWTVDELDSILSGFQNLQVEWNFLDGPWEGPFSTNTLSGPNTLALTPALRISNENSN